MKKTYHQQTRSKHLKDDKLILINLSIDCENRLKNYIYEPNFQKKNKKSVL